MNLNLWKSAAQIGAVVVLIASAGVSGGLGEPAAKDTTAKDATAKCRTTTDTGAAGRPC